MSAPDSPTLQVAVRAAASDLRRLVQAIETNETPVQKSVRLNLDVQLSGLRVLDQELETGKPGRRVWSLGQAAMPVLPILLTSVTRQAPTLDPELVARCRTSIAALGEALVSSAEGR